LTTTAAPTVQSAVVTDAGTGVVGTLSTAEHK
jgi:hypothetical protein